MDKITTWQRMVLLAMMHVSESTHNREGVWFTRRALELICWFDWHGYHTGKVNKLVKYGWLEAGKTEDGLLCYRLTRPAIASIEGDATLSLANARYVAGEQLQLV